ncbi:MAG: hypothetical protein HY537_01310 [Deltaproteobacteria bacterium]|nr:hypothetical protein [Deltaproteobacteria bacterium]
MKDAKQTRFLLVTVALWMVLASCSQQDTFYSNVFRSDVFSQLYSIDQYDFLWVMDNSDSMRDKRDYVKNRMSVFVQLLNGRKAIDYQMAITTTDYFTNAGKLVKSPEDLEVVSSNSNDPMGDFGRLVNAIDDSPTSFWEQGLESSMKTIGTYGSKFMRAGVPLIVIFLADEQDYSCDPTKSGTPDNRGCYGVEPEHNPLYVPYSMDRYINFFKDVQKAREIDISVFPIVGMSSSTCTLASLGTRYQSLEEGLEGGATGSICNAELADSMDTIARMIADRGIRFPLSSNATGTGVRVFVNGVQIPYSSENGFVYEAETNSIVFTGNAIPINGAIIEVSYSEKQN